MTSDIAFAHGIKDPNVDEGPGLSAERNGQFVKLIPGLHQVPVGLTEHRSFPSLLLSQRSDLREAPLWTTSKGTSKCYRGFLF